MSDMITGILGPQLRKWIAAACGAWITVLIENGVLTQPQVDQLIQMLIAIGIFAGVSLWTWAKNRITAKTALTVPTVAVPTVVSAVQVVNPTK
jgi:hypothetical protein